MKKHVPVQQCKLSLSDFGKCRVTALGADYLDIKENLYIKHITLTYSTLTYSTFRRKQLQHIN